jgi:hypothetical protein
MVLRWRLPFSLRRNLMLRLLKTIHTVIWVIMATADIAAFYLAFVGRFNLWFFIAIVLLGGEIIVIVVNRWHCPLTDIMARYTTERRPNFDIYLPEWLAKYNIRVFSALIVLEIIAVVFRRLIRQT